MNIKSWLWVSACGLLVCAAAVAGRPVLEHVGRQTRGVTATLALTTERTQASMLGDGGLSGGGVLAALAVLQVAGIVGFETWVLSRRRDPRSDPSASPGSN